MKTAEPTADFVTIRRIRYGKPAIEEIMVELDGHRLTIRCDWSERKQDFRTVDEYAVCELDNHFGRLFRLDRHAESVQADEDKTAHYNVLIAPEPVCGCRGAYAQERTQRTCKHVGALKHLTDAGYL
jgi:hypothetical protein